MELAKQKELRKPDVLRAQVERLLNDPKARRFTANFAGQWLDLRNINATSPDPQIYGEFDDFLFWSMPRETERFFEEILRDDRSLTEFRRLGLDIPESTARPALRDRGGLRRRAAHGQAAAGQPPRRRVDARQHPEGHGGRHADIAGAARQVGAGSDPGAAAGSAAARHPDHRARHPRRHHDPAAAR